MAEYSNQQEYLKYLQNKCKEHDTSSGCQDCNQGCNDCNGGDCTCCPVGLVAVYDAEGKHIACLTPNDAEIFNASNFKCQEGYVVLAQVVGGKPIFSCISEQNFQTIYNTLKPVV